MAENKKIKIKNKNHHTWYVYANTRVVRTVDVATGLNDIVNTHELCTPTGGGPPKRGSNKAMAAGPDRREWVTLRCASDRFDIDRGRVSCHCTTADFAAATDADVVAVVPAACRHASSMIAHAAASAGRGRGGGSGGRRSVEIAVRRTWVRCARPYRFAYVDGRRHGVMAVSAPFAFDHRGGPCDCDASASAGWAGDGAADDRAGETVIASDRATATVFSISAFVSSLTDTRLGAPRCPECNVPANYGRIAEQLKTIKDSLRRATTDVKKECSRYIGVLYCGSHCNNQ